MTVRRFGVYVDEDVQAIIDEAKPRSISGFFNCAVREHHRQNDKIMKLCEDVAEIKAMLSRLPNQTSAVADQANR